MYDALRLVDFEVDAELEHDWAGTELAGDSQEGVGDVGAAAEGMGVCGVGLG